VIYATIADMTGRFGEAEMIRLTAAPTADPYVIDEAKAQRALSDASATMDGYLRPRYALPLTSVPTLLIGMCCDLARFELMHGEDRVPTEQAKDARASAIAFLRDVGKGVVDLGLDAAGQPAPETPQVLLADSNQPRTFSADLIKDFR
jgi:phage gp36-like protein